MEKIQLVILGDTIVPNDKKSILPPLKERIDEKILQLIDNSDYSTLNLEQPFTDANDKIIKNGPCLKSSADSFSCIVEIGINLVTLGNNHIKDYGVKGIYDTIELLKKNDIKYIGVCTSKDYSKNAYFVTINKKKIGFYSLCENEFSGYKNNEIGSNVLELPRSLEEICKAKQKCDFLIVLFHGGKELYRYPTPFQQKICRSFIDYGADFVVCQHSHCIGCEEVYKNKHIVYGQGNFYFGKSNVEEYKTSMAICLNVHNDNSCTFERKYLLTDDSDLHFADELLSDSLEQGFISRSNELFELGAEDIFFNKMINNNIDFFYFIFDKNKWYSRIDRYIFKRALIKKEIARKKEYLLMMLNLIKCESHRDYLIHHLDNITHK